MSNESDVIKINARQILQRAVNSGKLIRPKSCSRCFESPAPLANGRSRIQGHHHDYAKPLDVEWLCPRCHRAEFSNHGEKNGKAKLTEQQVCEIRASNGSYHKLGAMFNVWPSTIRDIKKGKTWTTFV